MSLTIRQQLEQKRAALGPGPDTAKIKRLTASLKSKLATDDVEIITLEASHLIYMSHDQLGRSVFTRCDYVLGDPPLTTFSNFEIADNPEVDRIRKSTVPEEFSFEQMGKWRHLSGLSESKDFSVPGIGSGSLEDFKAALRTALETQFGGKDTYIYIVATYTSKVCINIESRGSEKSEYYEVPYTVRNGQFDFGTPVKVVKVTTFQKAEAIRRMQRLGGVKTDERLELRESTFDRGGVIVLTEAILLEGKTRKPMTVCGVAAKVGVTGNGRYYGKNFWEKLVQRIQEKVNNSRFLGELDHPMPEGSHGRLSETGVLHKKIYMDGDLVRFESEVLDTQAGQTLKNLLKGGVSVGASTRVFANTRRGKMDGQDVEIVEEDGADFVAIDLVSEPAVTGAGIQSFQ